MKCPGLHCPGCNDASGVTWLIVGGAAIGGAVWLISKAAHTGAALMSAAVPYLVSVGAVGMLGTLAYVAVAVRRDRARNAWLRDPASVSTALRDGQRAQRQARPAVLPARAPALARGSRAALPVALGQRQALPARTEPRRAVLQGRVITDGLASDRPDRYHVNHD